MGLPFHTPLDEAGRLALARALGESPQTVIAVHHLRRGTCRAWVVGEPADFRAAIVQGDEMPTEPTAFGTDAAAVWALLHAVSGWDCMNVDPEVAADVGAAIQTATGCPVRHYGDVYHALFDPPAQAHSDAVRRLTLDDLALFAEAPEFAVSAFGSPREVLEEGCAAGAVAGGRLVALAQTSALGERFADIGAFTNAAFRGRGYATAAAAIVCWWAQEGGRVPVWSCGEDNAASLRVAEKIGFREVGRRVYLIPERAGG
jgi:RimJ/RimL family protein N-acetyltransferase